MPQEVHTIKGVGAKTHTDTGDSFNPRLFHRGMVDLQEYILKLDELGTLNRSSSDSPEVGGSNYDEKENTLHIKKDTTIHSVVNRIPQGWDTTVVLDSNENLTGFAGVITRLDCGGHAEIWTKTIIRGGYPEDITIEFTDLAQDDDSSDNNEMIQINKVNLPVNASDLAALLRALSDAIMVGYTHSLSTPTRALDFAMCEPAPKNSLSRMGDNFYSINKGYWEDVRDTSRQTIFNNISNAGDELSQKDIPLHEDPIATRNKPSTGCLKELDPEDSDKGFIRLI